MFAFNLKNKLNKELSMRTFERSLAIVCPGTQISGSKMSWDGYDYEHERKRLC